MSRSAVAEFLTRIERDASFRKECADAIPKETSDAALVVAFAAKHNFHFTERELREVVVPGGKDGELTEEEAAAVSGGLATAVTTFNRLTSIRFGTDIWSGGGH